jgi:hypothetical protein
VELLYGKINQKMGHLVTHSHTRATFTIEFISIFIILLFFGRAHNIFLKYMVAPRKVIAETINENIEINELDINIISTSMLIIYYLHP